MPDSIRIGLKSVVIFVSRNLSRNAFLAVIQRDRRFGRLEFRQSCQMPEVHHMIERGMGIPDSDMAPRDGH